jgi:hydrogenase maturation protein HypF
MSIQRAHITITGIVQGVGFRPFIHRLAHQIGLTGWVNNTAQGVVVEVEGDDHLIEHFLRRIQTDLPPHAHIADMALMYIPPIGDRHFVIEKSADGGAKTAYIPPDLAICPDCLREMTDPHNRRYRYPFINCTHCGPRYSIMTDLPYDRPNTTMRHFIMCDDCRREYDDPDDRRFHAQPIACPACGPHIALWDADGQVLATHDTALSACADALRAGNIIAMKGLGGFHLLADATNPQAIATLRIRKHRPHKPFAVMFPTIADIRRWCVLDDVAYDLLSSPQAPIVLLNKYAHSSTTLYADMLAPDNPTLGVMLPYTPLHHLLLATCGFPLIATSGNRADEPICIDEHEALTRLAVIADFFLVHNRPIHRPIDDSVVRVMAGRMMIIRRARGYAPLPIPHPLTPSPLHGEGGLLSDETGFILPLRSGGRAGEGGLAVGAHLKNAVAIRRGDDVFISQHIGDLSTTGAYHHFEQTVADLSAMLDISPRQIACDAHPDYASTSYAHRTGLPIRKIQHHYAHALACMAENGVASPALAVVWDGTGYGDDGTVWGGEFLRMTASGYERVGHLRPFPLIGGDSAVIEPRKTALGWLYSLLGDAIFDDEQFAPVRQFTPAQRRILRQMVQKGINCPMTSSMGRLFDAVASLMDVCQVMTHEAQAAVMLENLALSDVPSLQQPVAQGFEPDARHDYPIHIQDNTHIIHTHHLLTALMADINANLPKTVISGKFHATLIRILVDMAHRVGERHVLLTGGCFMNKPLLEGAVDHLRHAGFIPHWHSQVPTGDGGICFGQAVALSIRQTG